MGASVRVGDSAPDFSLRSASGEVVSLSQFRGRSDVVLFFYPRDHTSVCTAEACSFRDSYEAFCEAGAVVIGISSDSIESHQQFAANHQLPFYLLSDPDGAVRARYGVPQTLWVIPGRTTYVIDKQGTVRHVFSALLASTQHVEQGSRRCGRCRAKNNRTRQSVNSNVGVHALACCKERASGSGSEGDAG